MPVSDDDDHRSQTETVHLRRPGARSYRRLHPRVTVHDGHGARSVAIERLTLVGSAQNADLVLAEPTVSRLHAELDPRPNGLWVRDLESRNGTWVNGVQVGLARVDPGAHLHLGAALLTVEANDVASEVDLWPMDHFGPLVGNSVVMRELFATLARIAASDSTVLVLGETGTGKEGVAQAIHAASPRSRGPLVVVDCAALPEQLLQSELFGHAKGAFTGAIGARAGAIEQAEGGTVFLDEIGELPLAMQPALLRVLESRTVRRLGESQHRRVDVRFVSATHRDLRSMVNAGAFREDLYFRLAVLPVNVPPLRDHMDDVPLLLSTFLPRATPQERAELLPAIVERAWLGNVRELRNFVERAATLGTKRALAMSPPSQSIPPPAPSQSIAPAAAGLPPPTLAPLFDRSYREFRDGMERAYVQRLLERHGGNVTAAAQAAGVDRTYIHRLLKKHQG